MSISAFIKYVEVFYDFSFIESIRDVSFHSFWFTYNSILENNNKYLKILFLFRIIRNMFFLNTKLERREFLLIIIWSGEIVLIKKNRDTILIL